MLRHFILIIFSLVVLHWQALAQERAITGIVRSLDDQTPLPGVRVTENGTTNSTVTDIEGKFRITLTGGSNAMLIFLYRGFEQQKVLVGGSSTILDVKLERENYETMIPYSFSDPYPRLSAGYYGGFRHSPAGVTLNYEFYLKPATDSKLTTTTLLYKTDFKENTDISASIKVRGIKIIPRFLYSPEVSYRNQDMIIGGSRFKNRTVSTLLHVSLPFKRKKYEEEKWVSVAVAGGVAYRELKDEAEASESWGALARVTTRFPKYQFAISGSGGFFGKDLQYSVSVYTVYQGFTYYRRRIHLGWELEKIKNYHEFKVTLRYILFNRPSYVS